jgi:hypothetical protein
MPAPPRTKSPPLKEIVFVDLDNVLVDFASGIDQLTPTERTQYEGRLDEVPGLFSRMSPSKRPSNPMPCWLNISTPISCHRTVEQPQCLER